MTVPTGALDQPLWTRRESPLTEVLDRGSSPLPPASGDLDEGRFQAGEMVRGRYRIICLLGRGAMGEVYRADDLRLRERVALKFLPEKYEQDELRRALLFEEVKLARRVAHPNVCRVYDVEEDHQGHVFLAMEYVDGNTLADLLQRLGRLTRGKATELGVQIARGLAAAHQIGILHRDLKPSNVLVDHHGQARITDFGLAGSIAAPRAGKISGGTPAYMAPEQFLRPKATVRNDLYSLGLVLYETFTGRFPFREPPWERRQPPAPPSRWATSLEPAIDRTILSCLADDPDDRPASAMEVVTSLVVSAWVGEHQALPGRPQPQPPLGPSASEFLERFLQLHEG